MLATGTFSALRIGLLVPLILHPQARLSPTPAEASRVKSAVGNYIRWRAYWEGPKVFPGQYNAGQPVGARVVWSEGSVAVFLSKLFLSVQFPRQGPNAFVTWQSLGWRGGDTNDSAARRYVSAERPDTDCVPVSLIPPGSKTGADGRPSVVIPAKRACSGGRELRIVEQEDIEFVLPNLDPPEAVLLRRTPETLEALKSRLSDEIEAMAQRTSYREHITIPYYSDYDPVVYVYSEGLDGCVAVYVMTREITGRWILGQILLDRPPNDLSHMIGSIKRAALVTVGPK